MLTFRGIVKTSVANLVGGGLSFVLSILVARLLVPVENGYYSQFTLLFNLLFIFMNLGLGNGLTYYTARGQLDARTARQFIVRLAVVLIPCVALMCLLAVQLPWLQEWLRKFDIPVPVFLAGMVCGFLFLMLNLGAALLLGRQRYDGFNLATIFRSLFPIILITLASPWYRDALTYALLTSLGMLIALGFVLRGAWQGGDTSRRPESDGPLEMRSLLGYSMLAYFSNLLHYSSMRGLAFSLSYNNSAEYVGYFSLALILLESVLILPGAMGQILFPKASGDAFSADAVNFLLRASMLIGCAASIFTYVLGPLLVRVVLGAHYAPVGDAFAQIAPSVVLMAVPRILSQVLSGRGSPQYPLIAAVASAVASAVSCVFIVPHYGIEGAAWTINTISFVTAAVTVYGYVRTCHTSFVQALVPTVRDVTTIWRFVATRMRGRIA